ncbi:30S ribosomal protein S9 [Planctomicrobium sp. SH664]|uniref:30S ribosomal protein S9 n=1 Tax=Planctomicrobium sp. SH664 TaxID=3448125 RepID=UPI003F5BC1F0
MSDETNIPASTPATLASGLDIGSAAASDADTVEIPVYQPTLRGKIDRFGVAWGTGRRKTSVARVRIVDGSGKFTVNDRPLEEYFPVVRDLGMIKLPLRATDMLGKVDVIVTVKGGGSTGQAGAVVLGIARALQAKNPSLHSVLSEGGFLTRDSRMVERKKYGKAGARRSFQFSKR